MSAKASRRALYDKTFTPTWGDLRDRDKRSFLALIAEPDANGCSAWHGQMGSGYPDWERVDRESRIRFRAQARRLLAQSHGMELSELDQVVVTCGNPGCMAWPHLDVKQLSDQRITEEEKRLALEKAAGRVLACGNHSEPHFRTCFIRQKSGNVTAFFRCVNCEQDKRHEKNRMGRQFKAQRRDF